jgi:hypothetical protein
MTLHRRTILLTGISLLAGCASPQAGSRPGPRWPSTVSRPSGPGREPDWSPSDRPSQPTPSGPADALGVIARSRWTRHGARSGHVNPMGGINRITVHHEGWKPVYFTSHQKTAARLERIRNSHVNHHGWGDIGYHFIVDRAGRIWEARDLRYQGAHVSDHNEHNIGVMVLGNFEKQYPSREQLGALVPFLQKLMNRYNVPVHQVHTHRELGSTSCPGRHLQPRMVAYRQNGRLT